MSIVMNNEKFIYLFGRVAPSVSMLLTMIFRMIPKFQKQFKIVREAQHSIGRDLTQGTFIQKIKNGLKIFSVVLSWSLEDALETSDSMKSRGYGLPNRTAFSVYRFDKRDGILLSVIITLAVYLLIGGILGEFTFVYYPVIKWDFGGMYALSLYIAYGILCILPTVLHIEEVCKWKLCQ